MTRTASFKRFYRTLEQAGTLKQMPRKERRKLVKKMWKAYSRRGRDGARGGSERDGQDTT